MKNFPLIISFLILPCFLLFGQSSERPSFEAGKISDEIILDGVLNEESWKNTAVLSDFLTTEPIEKGNPSSPTLVRVIANEKEVIIGIECKDSDPNGIVRFSKIRDAKITNEDHIKIVLDPFLDGQSGYIFAVNAFGARYDALVSNRGESENDDWDAIWDAHATINDSGWTVEIRLPIQSFNFKKGETRWGFNIERRIQRNQETIRWANVHRDQWFIQTSRAGYLTNLPDFSYGLGLNIRPSLVNKLTKIGPDGSRNYKFEPSLDVTQRISPNVSAILTVNTDFAETEVDSRQTNLTRFPLFFPEKRSFFLEGSDIFEFGSGTDRNSVLPFFSRRIGLYGNSEVPIIAGVKVNGRIGKTAFAGLGVRTDAFEDEGQFYGTSNMGVFRIRQNVFKESSIGILASFGDPINRNGSFMSGLDFTYQTTRFNGNKNFIAGAWALYTDREDLVDDQSAFGFKVDYPNDLWDLSIQYTRIGEQFDPSYGFVQRQGIHYMRMGASYKPRPEWSWVRQMRYQFYPSYYVGLDGNWQSYSVFTAPINWQLESGDNLEMNVRPTGENLLEPFEISENVTIPEGAYHFIRYRLEAKFAAKRRLSGQANWWFGSFYEGHLDEFELQLKWNPNALMEFEFNGKHNKGRLPWGDFEQTLTGSRVRFNMNSDLQLNSYVQYDTVSRNLGVNIRVHWIFSPLGDVILVFNHNTINDVTDRWVLQDQQLLLKLRYNFRM